MAKESNEAYILTGKQLYERTKARKIIPCTLSSDIGLGSGVPLGALILIGGRHKSGKSTFCLQCAANANQLYKSKIFIFPVEGRLTSQTLDQVQGLDLNQLTVVMPPAIFNKEGEVIGHRKWSSQLWFDKIGETIQENPGSVIILDSLSALSSEKEQSELMGHMGRGDEQKIQAQFCRKFGDLVICNQVAFFVITQTQANTSGWGPTVMMKVGNAIKFQADIIMFCKNIERWPEDENGKILGHDTHYTIECSALGPPHVEIVIPLRYRVGIDRVKDVINHAINWGLIFKPAKGSWYTLPFIETTENITYSPFEQEAEKEDKLEENKDDKEAKEKKKEDLRIKIQGEHAIWKWMMSHPEQTKFLEDTIRNKVFN